MTGGVGRLAGSVIGAMIIGVLSNGMNLMGFREIDGDRKKYMLRVKTERRRNIASAASIMYIFLMSAALQTK